MVDFLSLNFNELTQYLVDANKRIYFLYLVSAIALAIPVFLHQSTSRSLVAFVQFILPKKIYTHQSAKHDYALLIINKLILHCFP